MNNMLEADLVGLGPESRPIEALPMAKLEIDEKTESGHDCAGHNNALFIHEWELPEAPVRAGKSVAPIQGK